MKKSDINMQDVFNLQNIQKKLGLSLKDLPKAKGLLDDDGKDDAEKARVILNVPEGEETSAYLERKLNEKELVTIRKFVKGI